MSEIADIEKLYQDADTVASLFHCYFDVSCRSQKFKLRVCFQLVVGSSSFTVTFFLQYSPYSSIFAILASFIK